MESLRWAKHKEGHACLPPSPEPENRTCSSWGSNAHCCTEGRRGILLKNKLQQKAVCVDSGELLIFKYRNTLTGLQNVGTSGPDHEQTSARWGVSCRRLKGKRGNSGAQKRQPISRWPCGLHR